MKQPRFISRVAGILILTTMITGMTTGCALALLTDTMKKTTSQVGEAVSSVKEKVSNMEEWTSQVELEGSQDGTFEEMISGDGAFYLNVPNGWVRNNNLAEGASLGVNRMTDEKYLVILPENKAEFGENITPEQYLTLVSENMKQSSKDLKIDPIVGADWPAGSAASVRMTCTVEEVPMVYYVYAMVTKTHLVQVTGWTLSSREAANEAEIRKLALSLRVVE